MCQTETEVFVLPVASVVHSVGVVAAPVTGIEHTQFGLGVPVSGKIVSPSQTHVVAAIAASLLAWVTPCLSIVEVEVEHTCPGQSESLAERIVLQFGIDFPFHLPRSDTCLGVYHHESARQVAVFSRRNAAHHLHVVNVVGPYLPQVGARKGSWRELACREHAVVGHGHTIHHDARTECTRHIVGERAQLQVLLCGEVGVLYHLSGDELHDVGQACSLQVVDGLPAYL